MSANTISNLERNPAQTHTGSTRRWLGRITRPVLIAGLLLLSLLSTLPVMLLFVVTSVPRLIAVGLVLLDVIIVGAVLRLERTTLTVTGGTVALIGVSLVAVLASQVFATTPPIPGGIATLEPVELGGSQQWVTIRGQNVNNPVLLFLAGGPGGSELVMTRRYLSELEKHFVVVNWDQPGTGKSFGAVPFDALTPARYQSDAYELTQHLRQRFQQDRIYVLGESWGSILGIWLVQQHPDLFHAFISTGQMVAPVENDVRMYEQAVQLLTEQGQGDAVEQLRRNGPPPYASDRLLGGFMPINGVINDYMDAHAHGEGVNHNLLFDSLGASEYGLLDKINWLRGLAGTFTTVYPQIYGVDLRTQAAHLEVPVYFIKGRWDANADNTLLEDYFAVLDAPHKELIWFEHSAHTPLWDEPAHFVDVMVNIVLAQT